MFARYWELLGVTDSSEEVSEFDVVRNLFVSPPFLHFTPFHQNDLQACRVFADIGFSDITKTL